MVLGSSFCIIINFLCHNRACARAVDLGGQAFVRGGQGLKLSTKAAVFKRVSLLIGEAKHVDWRARLPCPPPLAPALCHKQEKWLTGYDIKSLIMMQKLKQRTAGLKPTTIEHVDRVKAERLYTLCLVS